MKLYPRILQGLRRNLKTPPRKAKRNRVQLLVEELESRLTPSGGPTTIVLSPATVTLADKGQEQFTATAYYQGVVMSPQPQLTWSIASGGVGQINNSGDYQGPNSGTGTATVEATSGGVSGTATVTIQAFPPVITQQASSNQNPVTGTQTALQVAASDPNGANLTYSWAVTYQPPGAKTPTFDNPSNNQPKATFYQAGSYTFAVTVTDSLGLSAPTSSVAVTVVQTPSNNLTITPANVTLLGGQTQQFTVSAVDQFGKPITGSLTGTWQDNGVGTISSTGLYTASGGAGSAQIKFSASSGANVQANVTVAAPPAAPSNLQASVQNGQVKLQWSTSSNNQTGFVVQYLPCCIPNPQWTTLATVASTNNNYTFTPPGNVGPTVEYQVYLTNAVGSSAPSNAVTVTVAAAAPTGLSAMATKGKVTLSWSAVTGVSITYDIYRATSSGNEGNTPIATGVTALTFTDGNVTGGTTYYYKVTAVDAAGQSPMSSEVSATPPQLPAPPTGLTASAGVSNVSLSWNAVSGASVYDIYRGTSSGGESFDISVTSTFFNDTGLTAFTTYYYQVSAVNSNGEGARSSEVSATPGNDWFSNNLPDSGLQALARTDFDRDGSITYNDMLGLLSQAVTETGTGTMSTAAVASLQAIASASGAAYLNMAAPLQGLAQSLVDGGQYQVTTALKANSTTAAQLQGLVNQWFLGENLPTIDTQYWGTSGYELANDGTLFGSSGAPQYTDVYQGEEGDCWLCASFAEIAFKQPGIIEGSFTDDGLVLENGVQVHVWTYSYFEGSTPEYMTLNNYFPSNNGVFMYLNFGQTIANTSNVLWAPLMEKAYAGLFGNYYANLNGGWAQNVLPMETGGSAGGNNPFGSESAYVAAIQSPTTLLTLASWSTNYGFVADHDYAVISVTGTGSTALFQLYNPWGFDEPPAITWAQLTQGGDFSQDGDTVVYSAAAMDLPLGQPPSGGPALSLDDGFSSNAAATWNLAFEFHAPTGQDYPAAYLGEIAKQLTAATPYLAGDQAGLISDGPLSGAKPDAGLHSQEWDPFVADLDRQFWASYGSMARG